MANCSSQMTPAFQLPDVRRGLRKLRADQPCQTGGSRKDQKGQNPLRPGAEEDKIALREDRARILKEELEHIRTTG